MSINKRFIDIVEHFEGGNKTSFCRNCGIKVTTLSSIVGTRQSDPSAKLLNCVINAYPEINALWLISGRGGMLNSQASKKENGITEQLSQDIACKECADKIIIIKNLLEQVSDLRADKLELKTQIEKLKEEPKFCKHRSA